ncbi:MAG: hypothetical protein HZC48_07790 [Nitrospirae bacterium]|nr:hypothetical protein [Nitrospirota bacterium]
MEWLLQLLLIPKRMRFRWRNRNRRKVTEGLIVVLKQRCDEATRANVPAYLGVYNVGLFIALLEQDISAYSESIFFAKSEWKRQFFARGLAVLLHEGAEDVSQLLGKQYRNWLNVLELDDNWITALNEINAKLSQFQKNNSRFLKKVRNYVGAHRDHNASTQLDILSDLKAIEVYRLGAEFSEPLRNLVTFYTQLLTYMHNPAVMLHQASKVTSWLNRPLDTDELDKTARTG